MASDFPIVGIGASAGGVEALEAFFRAMPHDHGMGFVVVTHLSPNRESLLAEILGRTTWMPVIEARDGAAVAPEQVHVLPSGATLSIAGGRLNLRNNSGEHARAPIDVFFTALAEDQGENAIGVILSGGGSDGTLGLKAIKERGGLTIAQGANATQPRFSEMPRNATAAGFVDLVLPVEDIPARLIEYMRRWHQPVAERAPDGMARVHRLLRARTGHDFSQYRDRTFQRRVQRRMQVAQTERVEDYIDRLEKEPEEVGALFRDLLIGVTGFFRDPAAFQVLETLVIPKIFEDKGAPDEVRIWVPGCATGEEAYSIAILCAEQAARLPAAPKVCIFATDIDETALAAARAGRYPAALLKDVAPERLRRFFVAESGAYRITREMREMCIFSPHSVIRDPPFSRLDLISCRNLLIYFKTQLQGQVIPLFHYALRPGGYLYLGLSESVARFSELFQSIDKKYRIFQRRGLIARAALPLVPFLPQGYDNDAPPGARRAAPRHRAETLRGFAATILENFAPVYAIVDEEGETLLFSAGTGKYLQAAPGPPTSNIIAMARPGLRADLRAALRRARESGQRTICERIPVQINGGLQMVGIAVQPLTDGSETVYGVVFTDQGPMQPLDDKRERGPSDATLQQLERELEETRERLQSTIEELETANEEFRSSNEELISVNEELQSTNEELETSKEELQSLNEELQTVNVELNTKIDELDRANSDLNNFIQSTQIATVFLDDNLVIRNFTPTVTRIFSLIPSDRGRPLTDIKSRIEYPELENDMRTTLGSGEAVERAVAIAGGKAHYLARIVPYRNTENVIDGVILTFIDVTNIAAAEEKQKALAGELNHRVKNTLTVVCSIVERTLPADPAREMLLGRLYALAQTHDLLVRTSWTDLPLHDLIAAELVPYRNVERGNVRIDGPPILLRPRIALSLALAIHELATNAAKYGALSVASGRVEVTWTIAGSNPGQLRLSWIERDGPEVAQLAKRGFGTELIERSIPFELQGETTLEIVDKAVRCTIAIPATAEYFLFASAARAAN